MTRSKSDHANVGAKIFYRPIEAAIRWCGLQRYESDILTTLSPKQLPDVEDFPQWPQLRLNTERIFDALINGDLAYGKNGITCDDPSLLRDPELSVRHVDLKRWMMQSYPAHKPRFLFDPIERRLQRAISIDTIQTLLLDREALEAQLIAAAKAQELLQVQFQTLHRKHETLLNAGREARELGPRSEATYLSIIGGLLMLLLGKSPAGKPYSSFQTVASIISALLAHYQGQPGISERTLWTKLAAAKRHLNIDLP